MKGRSAIRVCDGCGGPLAPNRAPGRPRKWCSERCRKQSLYSTPCIECGKPTTGDGDYHERCHGCNMARTVALQKERGKLIQARIEGLWAAGKTAKEIAAAMGWKVKNPGTSISCLRARGYNLPHRRTPEQVARISAGSGEVLARARETYREQRRTVAA